MRAHTPALLTAHAAFPSLPCRALGSWAASARAHTPGLEDEDEDEDDEDEGFEALSQPSPTGKGITGSSAHAPVLTQLCPSPSFPYGKVLLELCVLKMFLCLRDNDPRPADNLCPIPATAVLPCDIAVFSHGAVMRAMQSLSSNF